MFEWARNEFDGQSIEIIGQFGSTTFMPLSYTSINTTLRGKILPKDETDIIKKLICGIRNLELNNTMSIKAYAYEELIDFLKSITNGGEKILKVRFNQESNNEFEFYADDEFILAGYTMAFMIASGIGEIIDMSHYLENQKIKNLAGHNKYDGLLTIITFSDGQQLALFFQDDEVNLLLGTVQFSDKVVFRYGQYIDIFEWELYDRVYGIYELIRINASEWQDYFGEDGCSDKDDEYEEDDEYDEEDDEYDEDDDEEEDDYDEDNDDE